MLNYISIVGISSSFFNATVKLAKFQMKCYLPLEKMDNRPPKWKPLKTTKAKKINNQGNKEESAHSNFCHHCNNCNKR